MPLITATLFSWVRKTGRSVAGLCSRSAAPGSHEGDADGRIYRLRHWPDLPSASRTAEVLRLLSLMSHRPVNRRWMLSHTRLEAGHIDSLLRRLVARGAVEVIDASGFSPTRTQA
jgi:hypothetical protein